MKATIHKRYTRVQAAEAFGYEFNGAVWNTGCVTRDNGDGPQLFLFVTLDKASNGYFEECHEYNDGFKDSQTIRWQSQNRTSKASTTGKRLLGHEDATIHLFVRHQKKDGSTSVPFVYFGEVTANKARGEKPITIWFGLHNFVPGELRSEFSVPADK
jgi:hypothetical protein